MRRFPLVPVVAAAVLLTIAMGCSGASIPSSVSAALDNEVALASERLSLAEPIAAWKWHQHLPIEDLPREKAVLERLLGQADLYHVPREVAQPFFVDQMTASKQLQTALYAKWQKTNPPVAPDENTFAQARLEIDRVSQSMLLALGEGAPARQSASCALGLKQALRRWYGKVSLDADHRAALERALAHGCASGGPAD
ncbi:MAG: gamma subclass chorismate mutase AroQ [Janthinobacterium lividum]